MGLMQSGSNFTDRIVKYVAKWTERKTKPASPSRGHVIPATNLIIINTNNSYMNIKIIINNKNVYNQYIYYIKILMHVMYIY